MLILISILRFKFYSFLLDFEVIEKSIFIKIIFYKKIKIFSY